MTHQLDKTVLEDALAVSLARAMARANRRALEEGFSVADCLVSVAESIENGASFWRISYGPRNPVRRRGGELVVDVGTDDAEVRRVLRGQ